MNWDKLRLAAETEGYQLAHGQEGYGEHFFGLLIFVKMSNRKLCDEDARVLYRAADIIKNGLETITAELDPERLEKRALYRKEIEDIYASAGILDVIYVEELPNGYCSKPCCLNRPWFRVTSRIGHVVIGWRKRVMSIDWKDSRVKKSGNELFPGEDVTRWATGIHAHGVDAAVDYIRRLHQEESR